MKPNDTTPRSADLYNSLLKIPQIKNIVMADDALLDQLKDLATSHYPTPAFVTDKASYRVAISGLVAVAVLALIGACVLVWIKGGDPPDIMTALGSAALGALAGLLAPYSQAR